MKGVTIDDDSVELTDAETATAHFDILVADGGVLLAESGGGAVKVDGEWLVSENTFLSLYDAAKDGLHGPAASRGAVVDPGAPRLTACRRARPSAQVRPSLDVGVVGEPEDALGDDVAQHLGRAAADGERRAEQEAAGPTAPTSASRPPTASIPARPSGPWPGEHLLAVRVLERLAQRGVGPGLLVHLRPRSAGAGGSA